MTQKQKKIHNSLRKSRLIKWNRRLAATFVLILIINFNHNWRVAGENTGRNFQYESWQQITRHSELFRNVRDSDVFISTNQNDAYETNAGSFYTNSGIRLAYLFNTRSIFPDIDQCTLESGCNLMDVRKRVISTLPNLTRGTFVPRRADKNRVDDWVGINSKPGALSKSTIWAFDMFLLTPTTYFTYLAPFLDDERSARIDFTELRAITATSNARNEFAPAIASVCLVQAGRLESRRGIFMTEWKVPRLAYDPNGIQVVPKRSLDFREIQVGTCAVK